MVDRKQSQRKKRGGEWEADIEVECEQLRIQGDARVKRAEDAFRVVGSLPNGQPAVARKRRSEPDFYGLCDGGKHVSFDAKRTATDRFPLPDPRKPLKGWWHQVVALTEVSAFGGLGFLYVLRDDLDNPFNRERYVLPVVGGLIAGRDPRLDRSLRLDRLTEYRVRRGLTWLDVAAANLQWWST